MDDPAILRLRPSEEVVAREPGSSRLSPLQRRIIERGASRAERVRSPAFAPVSDDDAGRARLARWREHYADAPGSFDEMLSLRGIDPADAFRSVSTVALRDDAALPRWARMLVHLMDNLDGTVAASDDPVGELLHPLRRPLIPAAVDALRPASGQTLGDMVYGAAVIAVMQRWTALLSEVPAPQGAAPDPTSGWTTWFAERPAFARAVAEYAVLTLDHIAGVLEAVAADRKRLADAFGLDPERLRHVEAVRPNSGDSHDGGRTVSIVELGGGARLVHKPKDLMIAQWYRALCADVSARLPERLAPRFHGLLPREGHTWEEHVEEEPCADRGEAALFYERAGVLLALAQAAGAQDLHGGNILAHGANPLAIDLEVMASPMPRIIEDADYGWARATARYLLSSPLRVGMLPGLKEEPGGDYAYDGAFPSRHPMAIRAGLCTPVLDGKAACIEDFSEEFVNGYRSGRQAIAATNVAPHADRWSRLVVRWVPRATDLYDRAIRASHREADAVDTVDRELVVEGFLSRTPIGITGAMRVACEEARAMAHGDIPMLQTTPGSATVRAQGGPAIETAFEPVSTVDAFRGVDADAAGETDRDVDLVRAAVAVLRMPR